MASYILLNAREKAYERRRPVAFFFLVFFFEECVPVLEGTREVEGCRLYGPGPKAMSDFAQNVTHDQYYE